MQEARTVGKDGQHLRLVLEAEEGKAPIGGIAFGLASENEHLGAGSEVNLLANLHRNQFRNRESLDLLINFVESARSESVTNKSLDTQLMRLEQYFPFWTGGKLAAPFALDQKRLLPGADALRAVYRLLLSLEIEKRPLLIDENMLNNMARTLRLTESQLASFTVKTCLDIYEDAGLLISLDWRINPETELFHRCYNLQKTRDKVHLYETRTYKRLSG